MHTKLIMTVDEMKDRKAWEKLRNIGIDGRARSGFGKRKRDR